MTFSAQADITCESSFCRGGGQGVVGGLGIGGVGIGGVQRWSGGWGSGGVEGVGSGEWWGGGRVQLGGLGSWGVEEWGSVGVGSGRVVRLIKECL